MNLQPKAHIHFMGICGVGMASLASLLHQKGFKITGSDENIYPPMSTHLSHLGIPILKGYKRENLMPAPDLVIVGNVISRNNKEAQALMELGLNYTSWPQALMDLVVQDTKTIVVSGTHGKTTTSSMVSCVADECGVKSGCFIGGLLQGNKVSFSCPENREFFYSRRG